MGGQGAIKPIRWGDFEFKKVGGGGGASSLGSIPRGAVVVHRPCGGPARFRQIMFPGPDFLVLNVWCKKVLVVKGFSCTSFVA